ncbi:Sugar phosphate isomerase/epimerase [Parafrankia irregularis]|uniref:Sugar phosphate isomerase/epimerase n=1 Tax=Parafrankia irregularis TaxID=795642 RepID=A0A0S4QUY4_9ACTN|nr:MULTISPECIES: sugar phosphate isomerase/epimerase [Parafrankia]MBE3201787.1 sugar phosphate isomerase/epimerase [Parafrankia sp. CH37]CUU58266.1 Sugar phosphate isomerase/epimerase [Parafrankia irregularis]
MELGLFTACLPRLGLADIAAWCVRSGYQTLEVAAWPVGSEHAHQASHIDAESFSAAEATAVRKLLAQHGLSISAVSYYGNNLHADEDERRRTHDHLRRCVDAAARLEVPCVGTFVGRDPSRTVAANVELAEKTLPRLVDYARRRDVRLVVENCPMEGWHPDGYPGNLAYSPELWDWIFDLGFYLNYDPSHLRWLGIDPIDALRPALEGGKVLHVQAKDIEIDERRRSRYSVFGRALGRARPEDVGWWRYRVPGRGQLDWNRIIDVLHDGGFSGTVAVEHEDPVWSGSEEKVKRGLEIAARTLGPLVLGG